MNEGDVILTPLLQADGRIKNRPAIYLREIPPFRDLLVCGVSTQTHQLAPEFDELITSQDNDLAASGLVSDSLSASLWVRGIQSETIFRLVLAKLKQGWTGFPNKQTSRIKSVHH